MSALIDIANRALVFIGEARILSLSENSKAGREANATADTTRRIELTKSRWTFSMTRTTLAASATAPAWGFSYQYPFPADALSIDQVGQFYAGPSMTNYVFNDEKPFEIEGRMILCNLAAPLPVRYVRDQPDATQYSPLFVDVVAWRLANDLCRTLTGKSTDFQRLVTGYSMAMKSALAVNAVERPPARQQESALVVARL